MDEHSLLNYLYRPGPNMNMNEYQSLNSMLSVIGTSCYQVCPQMVQDGEEVWASYQRMIQSGLQPVKILVVGEFKTGKSTFINAFLGRELLCSEVTPTTAVVTYICYGPRECLTVCFRDGRNVTFDMKELGELTSENGMKYRNLRKEISAVYVYLPLPILNHITLIDSPGVNVRIQRHEEATHSILEEADYVVWVMSAVQAGKRTELRAISQLPDYLKPLVVVNRIDLIDEDVNEIDEVLSEIRKRIKNNCRDCLGVSSRQALLGIQQNDFSMYKESRVSKLVEYIETNLVQQWGQVKLGSIQGQMRKRKKMYYFSELKSHIDEVMSLQDWVKNNQARKKWENLDHLLVERKELLDKIDISTIELDLQNLYKEQRLFIETQKLENPINYIKILLQEQQIMNSVSKNQTEELKMMYQNLYQYFCCCTQYLDMVAYNPSPEAFYGLQCMVNNYMQCFSVFKDKLVQLSNEFEQKEAEYMKDKHDKIKEWREKNASLVQLRRKVNETLVMDAVSKFMIIE